MNWFTKLFSQGRTSERPEKEADDKAVAGKEQAATGNKSVSQRNPPACSEPVSIDHQKQSLTTLKKLAPLRDLDDAYIEQLDQSTLTYAPEAVIFRRGQKTNSVFYLLKGSIELQPDSDNSYTISAKSPLANLPLNSGKVCGATAVAKTDITILAISGEFIHQWTDKSRGQASCIELIDIELPEQIADHRFFSSFSQAYRENKLSLPSLPDVALKLKEAMRHEISIGEAVDIIQVDAPIVTKLIQLANSALYAPVTPITNCHDAVVRIGLNETRKLVMGISLKQLFRCKDWQLMKMMKTLWKDSLYVSSLSFVIAQECGTVDPEDALLAGLVSDIGTIPILHFADQYPDEYPDLDVLQSAIPFLNPPVGSLVLHTLGFSQELADIPKHSEDWFYESDSDHLTLVDIVILAKLHSYFGSRKAKGLPYINSIPAYAKLQDGKLNPDFSLHLLHKAQQRIDAAMNFFS